MRATCCPQERHDRLKSSLQTFVFSTRNLREMDSGDPDIRVFVAECPDCPGTLGYEVTRKKAVDR